MVELTVWKLLRPIDVRSTNDKCINAPGLVFVNDQLAGCFAGSVWVDWARSHILAKFPAWRLGLAIHISTAHVHEFLDTVLETVFEDHIGTHDIGLRTLVWRGEGRVDRSLCRKMNDGIDLVGHNGGA